MNMQAALVAAVASATASARFNSVDSHDLFNLTLEEQEALYKKITGPYCDEHALTDPLCVHRGEELFAKSFQKESVWAAPHIKRVPHYCARFPETCE